ncbi:MAG: hypothetical protein IJP35_03320 [Clostridia bacterium]|nr:hypothetical protein [Clostridia bacterium]
MQKLFGKVLVLGLVLAMLLTCLPVAVMAEAVAPDGVKEAAYTDEKSMIVNTTYNSYGGSLTENPYNVSSKTYYYWDDTNVYVWMDVYDPQTVVMIDCLYFRAGTDITGAIYTNGGGEWSCTVATGACANSNAALQFAVAEPAQGVRSYEFTFPHNGAEGFLIHPVVYGSATYIVSYTASYQGADYAKVILFDDSTTWFDNTADTTTNEDPDPQPDPVPVPGLVDGIKEEAYTDEKMTEISTAYSGQGGLKISNVNHVFMRSYYYWDDTNVYVWVDYYDPDNVVTIDGFYYVAGAYEPGAGGAIFTLPGGGEYAYYFSSGNESNSNSTQLQAVRSTNTDATRAYEFCFPHNGEDGFTFGPVAYVDATYTVSYGSSYLAVGENKMVQFSNPATHLDLSAVDKNVVTDESKLVAVQEAIQRLPEDPATLQAEDQGLVDEVKAVVETVPAGWLTRLDSALLARYNGALQRMLDIKAQQQTQAIEEVETQITALPDVIGLEQAEAVAQAKTAYDALGDLQSYVDEQLTDKLFAAINRINNLSSPIKIDGKLDNAYDEGTGYDISQEFDMTSASNMLGNDPDVYGLIYTFADENYSYVYVEVLDDEIMDYPENSKFGVADETLYDGIVTYVNLDPNNNPMGVPYQDDQSEGCYDFYFYMLANGTVPSLYIINEKNAFLTDPTNFVAFKTETGYGYEMRLPRIEGEESFSMNVVICNPKYSQNEAGVWNYSLEDSRMIALGKEWFANYVEYALWFYEDFPAIANYQQVSEMIDALPEADQIVDTSCKDAAKKAERALYLLNEDQRAMISAETEQHLTDVLAALKNAPEPVKGVYGDVDGNGKVEATDALEVLKNVVGKVQFTQEQLTLGDVDGNGKADAADALMILQKVVGKIEKFPVEQ